MEFDRFNVWKYDMIKPRYVCPHCGNKETDYYHNDDSWYCVQCDSEWSEHDGMWWDICGGHPLEEA